VGEVYQLKGGIHSYQEAFPEGGLFRGKNFVFDPRVAIPNKVTLSRSQTSNIPTNIPVGAHESVSGDVYLYDGCSDVCYGRDKDAACGGVGSMPGVPACEERDPLREPLRDPIVGRCRLCRSPYDDYRAKTRCSLCRMLVLVCDTCRDAPHGSNYPNDSTEKVGCGVEGVDTNRGILCEICCDRRAKEASS
jgi:hypothetical protein